MTAESINLRRSSKPKALLPKTKLAPITTNKSSRETEQRRHSIVSALTYDLMNPVVKDKISIRSRSKKHRNLPNLNHTM